MEVEGTAEGAGGALIGGENGGSARECLLYLWVQRGAEVHTPFIRLAFMENVERQRGCLQQSAVS